MTPEAEATVPIRDTIYHNTTSEADEAQPRCPECGEPMMGEYEDKHTMIWTCPNKHWREGRA